MTVLLTASYSCVELVMSCVTLLFVAGLLLQVKIGMDVAASEFQTEDKMYDLKFKDKDNDGSGKKTG